MNNKFRIILAIKKMNIAEVHDGTGISKTTLYGLYYEKTKNPSVHTVMKLCDFLDITLDEFFGIELKEA